MVSPSKRRKDRKGRENDDKIVGKDKLSGSKKSSKSFKPLVSKKFYLDIKNNASLLKLENKLKSLGATIEQFLVKEVNYVVTDRKDTQSPDNRASCSTPVLSPSPSPSPSLSLGVSSPLDGLGQKKSKSRAEAMLERVRLQPQSVKVDPLDNARSWNIPIFTLQQILARLEKICSKAGNCARNLPGLKVLRGNYLKIETGRRPEFKQLREWPTVKLNSRRGESAFALCQDGSQRMKKKLSKDGTERLAAGYCEMCCMDYPDIKTHVLTPQHVKYANNPDYYAQLDNVIKSKTVNAFLNSQMCASVNAADSVANTRRCLRSGSIESQATNMGSRSSSLSHSNGHILPRTRASTRSLDDSCAKKPLEVQCNGVVSVNHNHLTRAAARSENCLSKEFGLECEGGSKRTRTISASYVASNNEYAQLSPTGSDITHHLRSRKQMWLPTSLLGTTAEDALNSSRLRTSRDYPMCEAKKSPLQGKAPLPLRSPVSPVAEELADKKMKSSEKDEDEKFQSKSSVTESNSNDQTRLHEFSEEEDEAEKSSENNCKSSDSSKSRDRSEEVKNAVKKKSKRKGISRELANLSYESRRKVQKKRLSVEEKLIEDNKTYYKVEVLNSKLRSTGYYISQSQRELEMSRANGNDGCVTQNCTEPMKSEVKIEEKEPVVVRFKKVRQTELSILSDEAESFMFGEPSRRESSVSTESSSEDDEVSLKMESDENDRIVTKIKKEVIDESSIGSCSMTSSSNSSRRKRKSPDESTLQDNINYYKFEATGSRLRFHGSLFPSPAVVDSRKSAEGTLNDSKNDSKNGNPLKVKLDHSDFEPENIIDDLKPHTTSKYRYEDLEFSFENVPTHDSWYQTFKRQDECKEIYYPTYKDYPKVLLPYEYPNSVIRKIKLEALHKHKKRKRSTKEQKIQQIIAEDKPRKSPRCHASTLAIMSSLMRRRPRDSPEKKSEQPSELSMVSNDLCLQDEESRCSTIIEPPSVAPSVAPSDSQMSATQTSFHTIPEIRIDSKFDNSEDCKKEEADHKKAVEDIEKLFEKVCTENDDDVLAHMLQAIKKEVDSVPSSNKKGKSKGKSSAAKRETIEFENVVTCLPVDPLILDDSVENIFEPGPVVDMMNLIDTYRTCTSMERADYEHTNPHAADVLRVLIAESCNSSDCGGSSACDYSFLEDGKVCRKRKRKKRNMTGWPANNKRKCIRKSEELSTVVLKRNSKLRDGLVEMDSIREFLSDVPSEDTGVSEVDEKLDKELSGVLIDPTDESKIDVDKLEIVKSDLVKSDLVKSDLVKSDLVKSDSKLCNTISRTPSVDSSSLKSFDVQSCYIKVNKMADVETYTRHLRSSDSSPPSSKSSRRGSSRHAKIVGRESLRRCR